METLRGKQVLIVGATGGIGANVAKLLATSGAVLHLTGRSMQKLQKVVADNQIANANLYELDITSEIGVEAFGKLLPTIDILVNAAGIGIIKTMESLSLADFTTSINTNLIGTFLLVKAVLPKMKEQKKGLIINIPGVLGKVPMAGAAAYSASKYGIVGMMQSIREELKRTDIRITNLFLGGVDSAFWDTIDLRVQRDKMIVAEEAAKAIWFLCQQPTSGVVSEMVLQPFNHQAI